MAASLSPRPVVRERVRAAFGAPAIRGELVRARAAGPPLPWALRAGDHVRHGRRRPIQPSFREENLTTAGRRCAVSTVDPRRLRLPFAAEGGILLGSTSARAPSMAADSPFKLSSSFQPKGDQPQAIEALLRGLEQGEKHQVLLGITGSGKTFTIANVIARYGRPTLILAPNKTLAAQLYDGSFRFARAVWSPASAAATAIIIPTVRSEWRPGFADARQEWIERPASQADSAISKGTSVAF